MKSMLFCLLFIASLEGQMMHVESPKDIWKEENLAPFNELMLTWNAIRPEKGKFDFYVSVKTEEWSDWLLYATWGSDGQSSYQNQGPVRVFQDAVEIADGKKGTGFQIKVVSDAGQIDALHVYTNGDKTSEGPQGAYSAVSLDVLGLSQMTLAHERHKDLCSPTSTTAAVRFLAKNSSIDPVQFALNAWDAGFDIFGNWVFNVAEAYTYLGSNWNCWVERLNGFDAIYSHLSKGTPVIVSVRGPLEGSALPYAKGHLLAVIGYDPENQRVKCMDPAFPRDSETLVSYEFTDFMNAWGRRGNIAYVFIKK